MNAGMYGMSDGRGAGSSRLLYRGSNQPAGPVPLSAASAAPELGFAATSTVTSSSASTKFNILKINGKGALRFCLITNITGAAANMLAEVVVDGNVAIVSNLTSVSNSNSAVLCGGVSIGNTYSPGASLDFIPFTSSLEVNFMGSLGSYVPVIVYDLYQ